MKKLLRYEVEGEVLETFEECLEHNKRILYYIVVRNPVLMEFYGKEEMYWDLAFDLYKAYEKFDIDQGCNFRTLASNIIYHHISTLYKYINTEKNKQKTVSMNNCVRTERGEIKTMEYIDVFPCEIEPYEDVMFRSMVREFKKCLPQDVHKLLDYRVWGYSLTQISQVENMCLMTVNRKIKLVRERYTSVYGYKPKRSKRGRKKYESAV